MANPTPSDVDATQILRVELCEPLDEMGFGVFDPATGRHIGRLTETEVLEALCLLSDWRKRLIRSALSQKDKVR